MPPALYPVVRTLEPLEAPAVAVLFLVGLGSLGLVATRRRRPVWVAAPGVGVLGLALVALPYSAFAATLPPGGPGTFGRPAEAFLAYLTDHLGSVRAVVNASGTIVETRDYDPFGGDIAHTGTFSVQHRFTGQPADDQAGGFYNYGARFYNAKWGRFVSPDDVVQGFDSDGLNPYAYVLNKPTSATDPDGHFEWDTVTVPVVIQPIWGPPPVSIAREIQGFTDCWDLVFPDLLKTKSSLPKGLIIHLVAPTGEYDGPEVSPAVARLASDLARIAFEAFLISQIDSPAPGPADVVAVGYGIARVSALLGTALLESTLAMASQARPPAPSASQGSGGSTSNTGEAGNPNSEDQDAAIQLAKEAKAKGGLSKDEADALVEQARDVDVKPVHDHTSPVDAAHSVVGPHIRVGPVNHIPVKMP